MTQLQKKHLALIIKYTGISFITGGLSHGFFSGERQIITSIVGIIFFIIGTLLEQKTGEKEYFKTIVYSSILAVSLGALTGGLQHFPDSPDRSLWIVPLGFIISVYAYLALENKFKLNKQNIIYAISGLVISLIISFGFYNIVQKGYIGTDSAHYDSLNTGDNHSH